MRHDHKFGQSIAKHNLIDHPSINALWLPLSVHASQTCLFSDQGSYQHILSMYILLDIIQLRHYHWNASTPMAGALASHDDTRDAVSGVSLTLLSKVANLSTDRIITLVICTPYQFLCKTPHQFTHLIYTVKWAKWVKLATCTLLCALWILRALYYALLKTCLWRGHNIFWRFYLSPKKDVHVFTAIQPFVTCTLNKSDINSPNTSQAA